MADGDLMHGDDPAAGMHPPDDALFDFVDGTIGPAMRMQVESHLRSCESCAAAVAAARSVTPPATVDRSRLVEQVPPMLAVGIDQAVAREWEATASRLERARSARGRTWRLRRWIAGGALGSAAVAGIVAAVVVSSGNGDGASANDTNAPLANTRVAGASSEAAAPAAGAAAAGAGRDTNAAKASADTSDEVGMELGGTVSGGDSGTFSTAPAAPPQYGTETDLDSTHPSCVLFTRGEAAARSQLAGLGYRAVTWQGVGIPGFGFACGTPKQAAAGTWSQPDGSAPSSVLAPGSASDGSGGENGHDIQNTEVTGTDPFGASE